LSTRDPNIDSEDGHPIAYQAILQHSDGYENPPVFLKEDSEPVVSNPIMSGKVPEWMASAGQMATGERQRVLEDGEDKMRSSDEDDPKMKPDVLTNMYTSEMDPTKGPHKLSASEVLQQRATAQAIRAAGFPDPPQSFRLSTDAYTLQSSGPTRTPSSPSFEAEDGGEWMTPEQRRKAEVAARSMAGHAAKTAQPPRCQSASGTKTSQKKSAPAASRFEDDPGTRSRAVPEPSTSATTAGGTKKDTKAAASPRAPAEKATHPMETRQRASRAGGLRGVAGSGSNGHTRVAQGNPSSKPGS
jgi:hypothetical protein